MENKLVFTPEQSEAIEFTGADVLVSAGAGSGKTTVLSQRVLKRITEDRLSINDMLIVTFTVAAASSMREKIYKVLKDKYSETGQEFLWRESVRINSADICTIDSFQAKFIREHFELAGVSPDFTVFDDTERRALEAGILEDIIERRYAEPTPEFLAMSELFGGEGENEGIAEAVNQLYDYLRAVPFRDKWLDSKLAAYDSPDVWINSVCGELLPGLEDIVAAFRAACDGMDPGKQRSAVEQELVYAEDMLCACVKKDIALMGDTAQKYLENKNSIRFLAGVPVEQRCKRFRNLFVDICRMNIFNPLVYGNIEQDLARLRGGVGALFDVVREYGARIREASEEANRYSFDEISSIALSLTVEDYDPADGSYVPTALALDERKRFREIMIDEYQDINDRQDLFFRSISDNNLFIVGDVKQSIYAFRRANPENFISKRRTFHTIDLNANFRSRKGILDFSNLIFENLFSVRTGGMDYDAGQRLVYGADYPPASDGGPDVELMSVFAEDERVISECRRRQAQHIAKRIKDLVASGYVIRSAGGPRPVSYGDIAVLSRNGRGVFDIYEQEFSRADVPVYAQTDTSMFDAPEVNLMLNLLSVICNPYNDMALFMVLNSELYGFSAEDIARTRLKNKRVRLYTSVKKYSESDSRFSEFIHDLEHLRLLAAGLPLHRLLWHIYVRREYLAYAEAAENGAERRENLMAFYLFAKKYSEKSGGSIPDFLDFVQRSRRDRPKMDPVSPCNGDYVRLMTIHSSKGLEFPVCFVTGLSDAVRARGSCVSVDDLLGVGVDIRSESMNTERTTFMKEAVMLRKRRLDAAESIRLLYVAMTRAKERLILCYSAGGKKIGSMEKYLYSTDSNGMVSPFCVQTYSRLFDFVFQGLAFHPHGRSACWSDGECDLFKYSFLTKSVDSSASDDRTEPPKRYIGIETAELQRRFGFRYPYASAHIPAKLSVTEINKEYADETSARTVPEESADIVPVFISGEKMDSARYGTLLHRFCQYADLTEPVGEELQKLCKAGIFSAEEAKNINVSALEKFTSSELFQKTVLACERIYREKHFVVRVPASIYDTSAEEDEYVLMQGVMDMVCEFADTVTVIDFKSGADADKLLRTYSVQLQCYAYAAERMFEKPVSELYIWSFGAGRSLRVPATDLTKVVINDKI